MQNTIAPVAPTTPTPPVESRPSPKSASPHAFATLLKQSRIVAPGPAKAAPVKPAKSDGSVDTGAPSAPGKASSNAATSAAEARRADDARSDAQRVDTQRDDKRTDDNGAATQRDDKDSATSTTDATGTGVPPTHGLVALHRLAATTAQSGSSDKAGRAPRTTTASLDDHAVADAAGSSATPSAGTLAPRGPADSGRKDAPSSIARLGAGTSDTGASPTAETAPSIAKTMPFAPSELRTVATLPAAVAAMPDSAHASPAAPIDATVATPLTSPDFAQAFAVQVSVLVQDGVQSAELHLNPAEMGPVSVHIVVDGTQARIDFGADAMATRQAIEAGMPQLASSLRDAGMTLQGGGVSQHLRDPHRQAQPGDGSAASRGLFRSDDPRPAPVVRQRIVAAGGVDLYA